jgi:RNA polymerase I-specific transcription initiation factor RRN5
MKNRVVCEYKPSKRTYRSVDLTPQSPKVGEDLSTAVVTAPQILREIPQASLLHAENMLSLSEDLFMNRSPDLPSPWPHWSTYASEQVPQPSMMRTAFNDFHTLAVSVTRRLMQAAITQATSRLRSQRRRTKKGVMPFVKTRDVLSAIDTLGLKKNGRSRWTGVARRCNVRVFDEQRTTRFKIKQREISWDQAEQILGLYDAVSGPSATDGLPSTPAADSENEAAFKRRAARAGTPLPMEHLSLSNSDSNVELEDAASNSASVESEDKAKIPNHLDRETPERSSSAEPEEETRDDVREKQTLEQFDQEASRQEEEALCSRLELTIEPRRKSPSVDDFEDDDRHKLFNKVDDWRNWTEYCAVWEEHENPVPVASFIANQKPGVTLTTQHGDLDSDVSSTASGSPQRPRRKRPAAIELQAHNPRSYAAMQGDIYSPRDDAQRSDMSQSDDDADADVPTQSIEGNGVAQSISSQDAMDWER